MSSSHLGDGIWNPHGIILHEHERRRKNIIIKGKKMVDNDNVSSFNWRDVLVEKFSREYPHVNVLVSVPWQGRISPGRSCTSSSLALYLFTPSH